CYSYSRISRPREHAAATPAATDAGPAASRSVPSQLGIDLHAAGGERLLGRVRVRSTSTRGNSAQQKARRGRKVSRGGLVVSTAYRLQLQRQCVAAGCKGSARAVWL